MIWDALVIYLRIQSALRSPKRLHVILLPLRSAGYDALGALQREAQMLVGVIPQFKHQVPSIYVYRQSCLNATDRKYKLGRHSKD